jgi:hypothetical protein
MQDQLSSFVLGTIGAGFAVYGLHELRAAYFIAGLDQWRNRAGFGAAGMMLAGLFADLAYHTFV